VIGLHKCKPVNNKKIFHFDTIYVFFYLILENELIFPPLLELPPPLEDLPLLE
jgi:hypothetical protein